MSELRSDLMKDDRKTVEQLMQEIAGLREQNAALEKSAARIISVELAAEQAHHYAESIVQTIREPLLVLDADLKIISANRNFYGTFKVTPDETLGTFIYDLGNKQWDIPKLRKLLEEVLPEKEAFDDFEVEHHFESIGHKVMLLNARQIYRKDIGIKMILLAIQDVTERKQLENLLTESEERYRRLFETAKDGIVLLEKSEGTITHANPATEKMIGYTSKESIGKKLNDIGVNLDLGDFRTTMQNLNKIGMITYRDIKVETKSGRHIDTEVYLVDRAKLVQCNIRDITERKQAMHALAESEEHYRILFDSIDEGFCIIQVIFDKNEKPIDYLFLETNPAFETQTGLKDARGKRMRELAPKHEEYWFEIYGAVAVTGKPVRFENRAEQLHRWYSVYAFRFGQPENRQVAILFNDITNRKKTEEEIQLNELRLKCLVDILQYPSENIRGFLDYALGQVIQLTRSKIGYIYHYHEGRREFVLDTWSKDVMPACNVANPQNCYELDKTGIWGEAVRQRKPIILNDYQAADPLKKGYPEGHVQILKFMTVPVFKGDRIVGVVGLANKETDYEEIDLLQISLLMDVVWKVTDRKKAEDELYKLNEEMEQTIKERTAKLRATMGDLEQLNHVFVGREMKMIELKKRIAELEQESIKRS